MARHHMEDVRNIALVGHAGAGKTTLADGLLFQAKAVDRKGSVDDGTSFSDYDDEAKRRKFSIDSTVLHFEDLGKFVNMIDTPGYPDFVGQALCGLHAVENALIVINATRGVEPNTRKLFHEAGKLDLCRFIVINKLDGDNVDFQSLVDSIRESFGKGCVLFNAPIEIGPAFRGVVEILDPHGNKVEGCPIDLNKARTQIVEAIIDADEGLMEKYLAEGDLKNEEILPVLPKAMHMGTIVPMFCVSAKKDIGMHDLMDDIAKYGVNPAQGPHYHIEDDEDELAPKTGVHDHELIIKEEGQAIGQIFKVINDKFVGSLSFLRLFSGKITSDTHFYNARTGKQVRGGGMFIVQGKTTKSLTEAVAGDIVALAKMEDLHVGDTLGTSSHVGKMPLPHFPTPMFALAVEPKNRGDEQKISQSMSKMAEEDPTFKTHRDAATHELVVSGMSPLHLDVVQHRLKSRFNLEIITHEPKVAYRETIIKTGEGNHRHKKQSGGRGQFGEVHCRVFPLPREIHSEEQCKKEFMNKAKFPHYREDHSKYDAAHNFAFIDSIVGGTIPNQFLPAIYKGCLELLEKGALAGNRMQDMAMEVYFGKDHAVDSSEAAFKTAGRIAFKNAILAAHPVLLEPIVNLEVTSPSRFVGTILGDLNTKRARVENQDSLPGDLQVIRAKAPLAEVMRYAAQLGSMTQGQGSYSMEFSHYDQVPGNVQQQIVAKAGKVHHDDEE
jgi:elongation factor G